MVFSFLLVCSGLVWDLSLLIPCPVLFLSIHTIRIHMSLSHYPYILHRIHTFLLLLHLLQLFRLVFSILKVHAPPSFLDPRNTNPNSNKVQSDLRFPFFSQVYLYLNYNLNLIVLLYVTNPRLLYPL
jgi:hypothetical protein